MARKRKNNGRIASGALSKGMRRVGHSQDAPVTSDVFVAQNKTKIADVPVGARTPALPTSLGVRPTPRPLESALRNATGLGVNRTVSKGRDAQQGQRIPLYVVSGQGSGGFGTASAPHGNVTARFERAHSGSSQQSKYLLPHLQAHKSRIPWFG